MEEFQLRHKEGRLIAIAKFDGVYHEVDVTSYFIMENPHDEWLDYRLGLLKEDINNEQRG